MQAPHYREVTVDKIINNREPVRFPYDHRQDRQLTESIRHLGVLVPLFVRDIDNGHFEVIDGDRRLRAAKELNQKTVHCLVYEDCSDDDLDMIRFHVNN